MGRLVAGRTVRVILLPAIAVTMALSLSAGNFGIIVRERAQIIVLLLPLIAYGWWHRSASRSEAATSSASTGELPALAPLSA